MALNAYLTIKGKTQGTIKGSVIQKGREGWIMIIAVNHGVVSPRDVATGQATGKRQHKPLIVTKEIDQATPLLLNALVNNETLSEVELKFFTPKTVSKAASGVEVQSYTIKLINASIQSIDQEMLNNMIEPGTKMPVLEHLSFTYQKIEWIWVHSGKSATDSVF